MNQNNLRRKAKNLEKLKITAQSHVLKSSAEDRPKFQKRFEKLWDILHREKKMIENQQGRNKSM